MGNVSKRQHVHIRIVYISAYNKGTSNSETKSTTINDDIEIQGYQGVKNEGSQYFKPVCVVLRFAYWSMSYFL